MLSYFYSFWANDIVDPNQVKNVDNVIDNEWNQILDGFNLNSKPFSNRIALKKSIQNFYDCLSIDHVSILTKSRLITRSMCL